MRGRGTLWQPPLIVKKNYSKCNYDAAAADDDDEENDGDKKFSLPFLIGGESAQLGGVALSQTGRGAVSFTG